MLDDVGGVAMKTTTKSNSKKKDWPGQADLSTPAMKIGNVVCKIYNKELFRIW